jgi:hypothetical protein
MIYKCSLLFCTIIKGACMIAKVEQLYMPIYGSSCVLCAQCCHCLWIVHSWMPFRFSLTFIFYIEIKHNYRKDIFILFYIYKNPEFACALMLFDFRSIVIYFINIYYYIISEKMWRLSWSRKKEKTCSYKKWI